MSTEEEQPPAGSGLDRALEAYRADWESIARYQVYRSDYEYGRGQRRTTLATGLTYTEAIALRERVEAEIRREPGYQPFVTNRPICCVELENPEQTFRAYRDLCAKREQAAKNDEGAPD